jgi:transcriptional regulator with XRE-family HTH domain
MPTTLLERLFIARNLLERRLGRKVTHSNLGEAVAQQLRRAPFSAATVSQWLSGKQALNFSVTLALAKLCRVDPGWLAFGEESRAPAPEPLERIRKKTPLIDEYAGARPVTGARPRRRRPPSSGRGQVGSG